ncbi:ArnT family glycosyltransferase [Sulfurovum sp.]|uniref:ArnT family glycosyltransferase n=1 Tax=Sulfurovum sp. TaxID=1969726 RepID=UPI003565B665
MKFLDLKSGNSIVCLCALILIASINYSTNNFFISADCGLYINAALNLFNGNGYSDMGGNHLFFRSPFFPLIISWSYKFFGVSPWSAYAVIKIFCVLNVVVIYLLGSRLFNKTIGFFVALLIMSSNAYGIAAFRHIDAVWIVFVMLSFYFMLKTYQGTNGCLFNAFVSGFMLSLGFLAKETAILFIPIPFFFMLYFRDRSKKFLFMILFVFLATSLPWFIYVSYNSYSLKHGLLGPVGGAVSNSFSFSDIIYTLSRVFNGFVSFLVKGENSVFKNFYLAPLIVCAWLWLIIKSFKLDFSYLFVAVVMLCMLPLVFISGERDLRVGQLLLFYNFTFLIVVSSIVEISNIVTTHFKLRDSYFFCGGNILALALLFFIVCFQIYMPVASIEEKNIFICQNFLYSKFIKNNNKRSVIGIFTDKEKKCGEWISRNLPIGSKFAVSVPSEGKGIFFYSGGGYPIKIMPVLQSNKLAPNYEKQKDDRVIFLSSWSRYDVPLNKIFSLSENDFLASIKENKVDYIIVNKRRNYLTFYLDDNMNFSKIKEFGGGTIKIYRVLGSKKKKHFKTLISRQIRSYFRILKKNDSARVDRYVNEFFKPVLGWEMEEVDQMIMLPYKANASNVLWVNNWEIY